MVSTKDYDALIVNDVEPKSMNISISEIVNKYKKGKIVIPEIQRGFVWRKEKARDLILSLIQGYPIPPIYTIKTGDKYLVIDGQQRLKTILWFMNALNDKDKQVVEKILGNPKLDVRYVYRKYNEISYNINHDKLVELFRDSNIEVFREWLEERQLEFKVIELKTTDINQASNIIIDIFVRLNKGATVISEYDIVRALNINEMKPYFEVLDKLGNNKYIREVYSSEYFRQTRSFEVMFIITDFLINGMKMIDFNYSGTQSIRKLIPKILRDRREILKSENGIRFIRELEQTLDIAINDAYKVFGDIMFLRPNIDKKYAKITFYKGTPSTLATIFELLTVYYARKYNKDLLYGRRDELRHESIITFMKVFPQHHQTYSLYGDYLRMRDSVIEMIRRLSQEPSKTYYERSPKELKIFLWEHYISQNGQYPQCPYCKRPIRNINESDLAHIEPYSKTKSSDILNVVITHSDCNRYYGNKHLKI